MDRKKIELVKQEYDLVTHSADNSDVEFWYARDLMHLLGYERWENFDNAISRAMDSCETSGVLCLRSFS